MSEGAHKCSGDHEHHPERVFLELTPSGLKLNILALVREVFELLKAEDYTTAADVLDLAGSMLTAAYAGKFKMLDDSYEEALVYRLAVELDDPDALDKMGEERGNE